MIKDYSEKLWDVASVRSANLVVPGWKRPLDIICIGLTFPFWLPAMLLIALFIKIVSSGPVLFRQERIGFGSQSFTCMKFRTMRVNASTSEHEKLCSQLFKSEQPMTKLDLKGDKRLIFMGGVLRSTGLDELPQLINVLRGEMSLVGPRPCLRYEFDHYLPSQKKRFNGLPGLTGLWQVSGKNRTTFQQMIRLDIEYLERISLLSDLAIIGKTPFALARQAMEKFNAVNNQKSEV